MQWLKAACFAALAALVVACAKAPQPTAEMIATAEPTATVQLAPSETPTPFQPVADPFTTYVLLGTDLDRIGWGVRTDVFMIVTFFDAPGEEEISVWSIPRDLVVHIPCRPARTGDDAVWQLFDRVNSAWIHGEREWGEGNGFECVRQTVRQNFGIPVDGVAMVDFTAFMELVDAIGPLPVTASAEYSDWCGDHRNPGGHGRWNVWHGGQTYEMDGNTALCYARARNASNDLDRNRRQQDILAAGIRHGLPLIGQRFLAAPLQAPGQVIGFARQMVQTDLDTKGMLDALLLALRARDWPVRFHRMGIGEDVMYGHIGPASVLFIVRASDGVVLDPSVDGDPITGYMSELYLRVGCSIAHC